MKKAKSVAKLSEDAAEAMQLLVRLKASDSNGYCRCVTCGKVDHYKNMQGGHYLDRRHSATRLLEENIHPQCPACNGFGMKFGNAKQVYTLYMIDMYGRDGVENLIQESKKTIKWVRSDLIELIKEIRERIRQEESRVSGVAA